MTDQPEKGLHGWCLSAGWGSPLGSHDKLAGGLGLQFQCPMSQEGADFLGLCRSPVLLSKATQPSGLSSQVEDLLTPRETQLSWT